MVNSIEVIFTIILRESQNFLFKEAVSGSILFSQLIYETSTDFSQYDVFLGSLIAVLDIFVPKLSLLRPSYNSSGFQDTKDWFKGIGYLP